MVEGIRHDHIAETLRSFVQPAEGALVYLDAPRELREVRLRECGRMEGPSLDQAEKHSTEQQVATRIREQADFVVRAGSDLEAVVSEILHVLTMR